MKSREDFKRNLDPKPVDAARDDYVKQLERENNRLKKQVGTDQRLFESVKEHIKAFPAPKAVKYAKPKLKHSELHAVLIITDTHAEEFVRSEEMEGLASYDFETFQDRMDQVGSKTLELTRIMRQASPVRKLDVWALGDWFNGKIQPQEEAYGVTMPMPKAIPRVSQKFAEILTKLSGHFDDITVTGVVGNHGRDQKKTVFKMTADRNWDMSVYLMARAFTANCPNIKWQIPESIMTTTRVMGWNCLLTHSGEVNMNNRTPYYPIESTFDMEHKARSGTDKDFQYAFMGHWHHDALLDNCIYLNPSMIGANQFSRFKLHRKSKPAQNLFFFSEKHGCQTKWTINLK